MQKGHLGFAAFVALMIGVAIAWLTGSPAGSASGAAPVGDAVAPNGQPRIRAVQGGSLPIEGGPDERDEAFYLKRTAGDPNVPFTMQDAAAQRTLAAHASTGDRASQQARGARTFGGSWSAIGPDPIVQLLRDNVSFGAMSGRVSALAIRSSAPYTIYLGAAQGGIWISSTLTSGWTSKSDQLPSLAIGAIALAPSNEDIVYVGTGEGNLSGDSYFGNGVLKSTDGGNTFTAISAAGAFSQVSISKIVVNPTDPNHLYVATLRGRGGARRVGPPSSTPYGVFESTDGGVNWTGRITTTNDLRGATDLVIDPINPSQLYVSFWGQGISKTVDSGLTWTSVMTGFPAGANYSLAPSRFSLALSHPSAGVSATLYTGFEYYNSFSVRQNSSVWKSTNEGQSWSQTSTSVIGDYCGSQCWYDNVVAADPLSPTIVYALGLFNYNTGSGGIFRSMDGGASWVDLGFDLHPDYHAIAIRHDSPSNIVIGNDGGVWSSASRGGRLSPSDGLSANSWTNLNGLVNPSTAAVIVSYGLQIAQFTSIAQHPVTTGIVYGGTQDNGTLRRLSSSNRWYDYSSCDGGQVVVDPTDPNYVFGTYYGLSPYRFTDGMLSFLTNSMILGGINQNDRSEFYVPLAMDPANPNRLYLGSYRLYRTDNAKASSAGSVLWQAISADLTSGCAGTAPNGARNCSISAIGVTAGAPTVYVGTLDGYVQLSTNATSASPTWLRVDKAPLPARPVGTIAVDQSDYRVALVGYSGFSAATPSQPGHVFKTADAGTTWTNLSGNLPDVPVNSLLLDPSAPATLYAGTDIGPYVTTDGGTTWALLGTGFPIVAINQLDLNPATRLLRAGTHGRGAWTLTDTVAVPALQIRGSSPATPIGPGSLVTITAVTKNVGNAAATGVAITNVVPVSTTFVSAGSGGTLAGGAVVWSELSVAAGSAVTVSFTVQVTTTGTTAGSVITNAVLHVMSAQSVGATASPFAMTLAQSRALSVSPASQNDGARAGHTVTYTLSVSNNGSSGDSYDLLVNGNAFATIIQDASCTSAITRTQAVSPGASTNVCARVAVPSGAANGAIDLATVTFRSVANPAVSAAATVSTTAITFNVLLVDQDGSPSAFHPEVKSYYQAALTAAGYQYNSWDLAANPTLPPSYLKSHPFVVWFTGASYPAPLANYETLLASYLDGGGRLFMSGMDILDQAAGTTSFVHNYLHINWDGTETQNDKGSLSVTAVGTNTVMSGLGTLPLNVVAIFGAGNDYSDQITPTSPALPALTDQFGKTNALTLDTGVYKVVFLAFPFEAIGTANNRADLLSRVMAFFGANITPTPAPSATSTPSPTPTATPIPSSTVGKSTILIPMAANQVDAAW